MIDFTSLGADTLFRLGGAPVTLGGVATGVVVFVVAWALSRVVARSLGRLRERSGRSAGALYVLEKMASYGLIVLGIMSALSAAGLNLSALTVFAGALGIGVGLGLQGVVKEFVSGLFLIFDRMVSVGDYVELEDDVRGVIAEIGPRATRLRNNDNINILVPNSRFIEDRVVNWTLKGDTRRIHIPFSVAYGAKRSEVREAVLEAARTSPFTLPETETRKCQVWLVGFGESGLDFELLVWPTRDAVKRPGAMHAAYTWAIADALDAAGIEIPFPQTDLRIRSVFGHEGEDALETLGLRRGRSHAPAAARTPPADPTPRAPPVNDAAEDLMTPPEPLDGEAGGPTTP